MANYFYDLCPDLIDKIICIKNKLMFDNVITELNTENISLRTEYIITKWISLNYMIKHGEDFRLLEDFYVSIFNTIPYHKKTALYNKAQLVYLTRYVRAYILMTGWYFPITNISKLQKKGVYFILDFLDIKYKKSSTHRELCNLYEYNFDIWFRYRIK
jgi:hypothetical protein